MRATPRRLILTLALALPSALPGFGPTATMQQAAPQKRPIELRDIINWRAIGTTAVSNDGQWFAYRLAPGEGDAQIVVRRASGGDKELQFHIGEVPAAGAGAGGGGRGGDAGAGSPRSTSPRIPSGSPLRPIPPRRERSGYAACGGRSRAA